MSMEMQAWHSLYQAMHARDETRPFSAATLRRIAGFARPHRRRLAVFLALSVVGAVLAVATPVLAGRVVDAIDTGGPPGRVIGIAVLIAVIAVAEAGLGVVARWFSARIGEGLILDLRAAVFAHVQRMPVAFSRAPAPARWSSRLNNDVIGAQRAFSDTLSGVAGNVVTLALALGVMLTLSWQVTLLALALLPVFVVPARRIGRRLAQLEREAADHNAAMGNQMHGAVLRARGDAGQAVRTAAGRVAGVRLPGRAGARHRRAHRDGAVGVRHRADAGLGAGARTRVRPGRLPGVERPDGRGRRRRAGSADHPAVRAADRAGGRPGRGDERAGQLRAGVRDPRPAAAPSRSRSGRSRCPVDRCR